MTQRQARCVSTFVIGYWSFIGHCTAAVLLCAAAAIAQDRVTVTQDEKTITLSNRYSQVEFAADPSGWLYLSRMDRIGDARRKVWVLDKAMLLAEAGDTNKEDRPHALVTRTVVNHDDGSVTVAMQRTWGGTYRVAMFLHMQPDVAAISWAGRAENFSDRVGKAMMSWHLVYPSVDAIQPLHSAGWVGWYLKPADTNVVAATGPQAGNVSGNVQEHLWSIDPQTADLPAYSAITTQVTVAVVSGIGPVSAASQTAAISVAKDVDGRWMIGVAPYGRLIDSQIAVTAGLKTYQQTVNAGPREPFIVQTPLTDEKIAVAWRDAQKKILLQDPPAPPEIEKQATSLDARAISKQRVAQMNDALKAMRDGRWADALALSEKSDGDGLWMKLIGALAERQAGHAPAAETRLRRIVGEDPAAGEAWLLLGETDRAEMLGDAGRMRRVIEALRSGHLPNMNE